MGTPISLSAEDYISLYIEGFYSLGTLNQEAYLYSYSLIGARFIMMALKKLGIVYTLKIYDMLGENIYVISTDYKELTTKAPELHFKNTFDKPINAI